MQARGKTIEEVEALLDEGVFDMARLDAGGWLTALKYADEVTDLLAERTGGKKDEFSKVSLRRYQYGTALLPDSPLPSQPRSCAAQGSEVP